MARKSFTLVPNLPACINFWRLGVGKTELSTSLPNCCIACFPVALVCMGLGILCQLEKTLGFDQLRRPVYFVLYVWQTSNDRDAILSLESEIYN